MKYPSYKRRTASVFIKWSVAALLYFLAPHLAIIPPLMANPTILDRWIPILPWTVVIYVTLYFQVMFCMFSASNIFMLRCMLQSYIWLTLVLSAFYIVIPIRVPLVPFDHSSLAGDILEFIRGVDVASNSLPSGHVAYSLLGPIFLFTYGDKNRVFARWFFLFWGVLVALSTLTTKQHFIGDVICGFILAMAFGWVWGMYAREQVIRRLKGRDLKLREKWKRRRFKRKGA